MAAGCLVVAGCAASDGPAGDGAAGLFERPAATQVRSRLLNDENGLEIRQLVISDDAEIIAAAMSQWVNDEQTNTTAIDRSMAERLRNNGFRLVRVPIDEMEELVAQLGQPSLDVSSWQGQVFNWRDLHALPIRDDGRAIAVDGRVRRYEGGSLRLMVRGWVVQMENGPRLQLELVPQHHRSESRFHRLLGQQRSDAQPLPTLAMHLLLESGYAYVLTCECPQRSWSAANTNHDDRQDEPNDTANNRHAAQLGPDVDAPPTIGELMLTSEAGQPSRGVLVFIPRIAPELFPEHATLQSRDGGRMVDRGGR